MSTVAARMSHLQGETAFAVAANASALAATGTKVYAFHVGDLNVPTPISITTAVECSLRNGNTGYCHAAGVTQLREALATHVGQTRNLNYTVENVSVQPGGKAVIGKYIAAFMNEGDVVLYPNPGYPIYESQIEFYGGVAHPYGYIHTDNGMRLDFAAIEAGIKRGARHIFFNNYNNPTGASASHAELLRLAELARSNDVFVISDEAYFDLIYDDSASQSIASLPGMYDRTLILYTFSKTFAMTGWRLGGAVGPKHVVEQITRLNGNMESCTTHFVQFAGLAALRAPPEETRAIRDEMHRRRDLIVSLLREIEGVEVHTPAAGLYVFPRVTALIKRLKFRDVEDFRLAVLYDTGVSFCCRHHFGRPQAHETDWYIRLAFSGLGEDDIRDGIQTLKGWVRMRSQLA